MYMEDPLMKWLNAPLIGGGKALSQGSDLTEDLYLQSCSNVRIAGAVGKGDDKC